jgi:hypothetical protein
LSTPGGLVVRALRRRLDGTNEVDPWGLDLDLHALVAPVVAGLRVDLAGAVPAGPVLLLTRRRLRTAVAALRATGRVPRVLGIPDVEPLASVARRLGGAVHHPAEAAALLRAGHLVIARHDAAVLAAAERAGAAVCEVAPARLGDDMRVSERWVTSAPDAVHLLATRDPDPLRGVGSRRR